MLDSNSFGPHLNTPSVFAESPLPNNYTLETLSFMHCALGSSTCRSILESLQGSRQLKELKLSCTTLFFDRTCAVELKELLQSSTSLQKLFVARIVVNEVMGEFADGVRRNTSLEELDMSFCQVENAGLMQLGKALIKNVTLKRLNLNCNPFDNDAVSRFFKLLPRMKVEHILLRNSLDPARYLDERVCSAIVAGLRVNTSVVTLGDFDTKSASIAESKRSQVPASALEQSHASRCLALHFGQDV